jgi:transposase InsO family protein
LRARPPVPKSCAWRLAVGEEQRILEARARTNYGPARLAGLVGYRRSTIWKVLARHGCSRRRRTPRERSSRRYEWAEPGALLHMDTKRLQRFRTAGHWATGDRTEIAVNRGAGYVYAHCVVDDHSRLAYVELHGADSGHAAATTLRRAGAWMREQGCGPTEAVMTDNAFAYRHSRAFAAVLDELGARHIRTPPYTPRWNGKVERFIQTLDDEWAHGHVWPNSTRRDRGLASWLRFYNRRRPHTSLNDRPPISRVHQDRGHNS